VAPGAVAYAGPVTLDVTTEVKARILNNGNWSPLSHAVFATDDVRDALRITEIMYHPQDAPDGNPDAEFIELQNIGGSAINLEGVRFTNGVTFEFPNMTLAPGEYVVVVLNIAAFTEQYGGGINVAGGYTGRLSNAGERIELVDALGNTIHNFRYEDNWYDETDGGGHSLTIADTSGDPLADWGNASKWRASSVRGGTPGTGDGGDVPSAAAIIINELLAHSHATAPDWVELHNTSGEAIDVSGWFLSDSATVLQKYELPQGSVIAPGGYLVLYENQHFNNFNNPNALVPFAFSSFGESAYLSSGRDGALTGYRTEEDFGASRTGVTFGRHILSTGEDRFVPMSAATPGAANAAPEVGVVVITEIMYDPPTNNQNEEYVELYNRTGLSISFQGAGGLPWRFTNGIEYSFPVGTSIPAGGRVIIASDPAAFAAAYGNAGGATVLGPYGGRLSDGEGLELSEPAALEPGEQQHYYRVDHVRYDNNDPWPSSPNGGGDSLHRVSTSAFGNDPASWEAASPSPGN